MEEHAEMEEHSTSREPMLAAGAAGGTFIAGTADAPVAATRYSTKRHQNRAEQYSSKPNSSKRAR